MGKQKLAIFLRKYIYFVTVEKIVICHWIDRMNTSSFYSKRSRREVKPPQRYKDGNSSAQVVAQHSFPPELGTEEGATLNGTPTIILPPELGTAEGATLEGSPAIYDVITYKML